MLCFAKRQKFRWSSNGADLIELLATASHLCMLPLKLFLCYRCHLFTFTVLDCGYPQLAKGAFLNPWARIDTTYQNEANYECLKGKWVKRGQYAFNLTCSGTGKWEPIGHECQSKKLF